MPMLKIDADAASATAGSYFITFQSQFIYLMEKVTFCILVPNFSGSKKEVEFVVDSIEDIRGGNVRTVVTFADLSRDSPASIAS